MQAAISKIPDGDYSFTDYMDDDGLNTKNIKISVTIKKKGKKILFDFSEEQLYGNQKEELDKRWGFKPRTFFQKFGTEYGQFILPQHFPTVFEDIEDRQFWVKRFWIWYEGQLKKNPYGEWKKFLDFFID